MPLRMPSMPAPLAALCAVALALRFGLAAWRPNIAHADEIFQYVEQAHRLVHGVGLVPWEFQLGIRNWLIPGLLAPVIAAAGLVTDDPGLRSAAVALFMSALGLVPVVCAWRWGQRAAGPAGALLAAGLNAVWFEMVYYAAHPLADTLGVVLLVGGLCLADTARRPWTAGLLLGLMLCVRLQLAPAVLVMLPFLPRRPALLGGIALALTGLGLLDWLTLGLPWQSIWLYARVNLGGVASGMSTDMPGAYLGWMLRSWGLAAAPLLAAIVAGAWRRPLLALPPLAILAAFSAIAHKEARFVTPALPFLLTLAGIGTARLLQPWPPRGAWIALAAWAGLSGWLAQRPAFTRMLEGGEGMLHAMHLVAREPGSCGLAIYPEGGWPATGGYAHMRPGMSLYGIDPRPPTTAHSDVIAPDGWSLEQYGYWRRGCWNNGTTALFGRVCLWQRTGACDPDAAAPLIGGRPELVEPLFRQSR